MDINKIHGIIDAVEHNITGRIATLPSALIYLLDTIADRQPSGAYVEIGTLYGGTAIAVGLLYQALGLEYPIICIDPLDGYYGAGKADPVLGLQITKELVENNAYNLGVDLTIYPQKSQPLPDNLPTIGAAYIDGDHEGNTPTADVLAMADLGAQLIFIDNVESKYPAVSRAVAALEARGDYIKLGSASDYNGRDYSALYAYGRRKQ